MTKQELIDLINQKFADGSNITASEHREVELEIADIIFEDNSLVGDIKEIDVDINYINANFDMATGPYIGRGKVGSERYGWAICNGYNGTQNRRGRVPIGYGSPTYPTPGYKDGEEKHTLLLSEIPSHNHTNEGYLLKQTSSGNIPWYNWGYNGAGQRSINSPIGFSGGGLPHNNMQPYIVTVFIQRIPTPYV